MNKIFGSIITAIALWAGTTAFVGTEIENNLQKQINHTNRLSSDYGVQYKLKSYEKNFLESKVKIELEIIDPTLLELLKDSFKLPIIVEYKIEHGPIFFKNGLGFGAVKIDKKLLFSSLLKEEAKKEFLERVKEDILITNSINISFTQNASYTLFTDKITIKKDGNLFEMSPITIKGESNIETWSGHNSLKVDSMRLEENQKSITLDNLSANININEFIEEKLMLGTIDVSVDKLQVKDNKNPNAKDMNIAFNFHVDNQKDTEKTIRSTIEGDIDFKDTKLPLPLPSLQKIDLKMNLEHLGTKGLIAFQEAGKTMQKAQQELFSTMNNPSSNKDFELKFAEFKKLQMEMVTTIINSLNDLLVKDKTSIAYEVKAETKDKKESLVSVNLGYTGDIEFKGTMEEVMQKVQQKALDIVQLHVDLKLNKIHLKSFPDARSLTQQIQMGVTQGFVKETKEEYLLKGYYKNRELIVNDNNLTALILPFLMMGQR